MILSVFFIICINVIISYIEVITMNKILILYKSKYGATKKYAYMLKKEIACDVFDVKDYQKGMFDKYELVIFASAIYASGISGLKVLKKNYAELKNKKVIIFCVGASPYDKKAFDEIRAYINAGASVVGVGRDLYEGYSLPEITKRAARILAELKG